MSDRRTRFFSTILDIGLGTPAEAGEHLVALDLANHRMGLVAVEGGHPEDHVLEDLDEDAAHAEHDQRADGVTVHPEDDFFARLGHLLDEDPDRVPPGDRTSWRSS